MDPKTKPSFEEEVLSELRSLNENLNHLSDVIQQAYQDHKDNRDS